MILAAQALSFRYGPAARAAAGRDIGPFDAAWGPGLHVVHGPNGAGKSTLLRMLAGSLHPRAGRATLDGVDIHRDPRVRARIGLLTVDPELPDFVTVEEAWRLTAALRGRPDWDGADVCLALGLTAGRTLGALSTGQRKKAELVAAFAGDPDVLLLDEPFASLDDAAVDTLGAWLDTWRHRIVLVATHDPMPVPEDGRTELALRGGPPAGVLAAATPRQGRLASPGD